MESLLDTLLNILSADLRDAYLTTVVEQEINHTVLINNDLTKRCVWIQNLNSDLDRQTARAAAEFERRVKRIHTDLIAQLPENQIFSSTFVNNAQREQLLSALVASFSNIVDNVIEDYKNKVEITSCTYGVDKKLLIELQEVDRHIKLLTQNRGNFKLLDEIKT